MSDQPFHDLDILILAPLGKDATRAAAVLEEAHMRSEIVKDVHHLCERLTKLAGAVISTEEAINNGDLDLILETLDNQESWSDIPLILITSEKQRFDRTKKIIDHFGAVGNISLLERPFSVMTLVTMTKVAIRSREKQYQIKKLFETLNVELKSKDEFLSIASHELKTPITSLKMRIQMKNRAIQKGDPTVFLKESFTRFLGDVEKQINRLSRLVDDMLDITRIENGKLSVSKDYCELGEIASTVCQNFWPVVDALGFAIELDILGKLYGNWDKYRIEQVITNLISNAIKYGNSSPIILRVFKDADFGVITVKDHGPGISDADQKKIFNRYERGVSAETNTIGLGLGLYISRQIADMHQGLLKVESKIGEGSLFTLRLPLH